MNVRYMEKDKELFDKHCKKYKYYPLILPARKDDEEIFVIGDLHGDYKLATDVLKLANVIDDNNKWIGGNTYIIQVGDQLDNCRPFHKKCNDPDNTDISSYTDDTPEDIKVFNLFTNLNKQATKVGGAVISLIGNHELMNSSGNLNYVSYKDLKKSGYFIGNKDMINDVKIMENIRKNAFKPGGDYAKILACTRLPALIIGSYIFVHAGFINKFIDEMNIRNKEDLYKLSYGMRMWLFGIIDKNNVVNIINSKPYSPFWDRILGGIPPNMSSDHHKCAEHLNHVLEIFNVGSMVIGHTPQYFTHKDGINSTCDDKLWRVDFGGSFGFHPFDTQHNKYRKAQILRIRGDNKPEIIS